MDNIQTIQIGNVMVSILTFGTLSLSMADIMDVEESDWKGRYDDVFSEPIPLPIQCTLIQHPEANILVDASAAMSDDQHTKDILAQLNYLGVAPDSVKHIVITHPHPDHLNGMVTYQTEFAKLNFPNAMHYIGEVDVKNETLMQYLVDGFGNPTPVDMAHLHQKLTMLNGDMELLNGISIIATPGETEGHHMVRVHSSGQTLYIVGDLLHHHIEVENPDWSANWADQGACLKSRQALFEAALRENAFLMASHISGFGQFKATDNGVEWITIDV